MTDSWSQTRLGHRARQSEAIAAAALSLILEHGASALAMSTIAAAADISRQTLYRYFPDIDAVLVGIANLIASHDDHLETEILGQSDPAARLDLIVRTVANAEDHDPQRISALRGTLPPRAREILANHEDRIARLLADVLRAGMDNGVFRRDLEPSVDAPLVLGLAAAANPPDLDRAIALIHRIVDNQPKENQP